MSFITWLSGLFSSLKTEEDNQREYKFKIKRRANSIWVSGDYSEKFDPKLEIFCNRFENKEGFLFDSGRHGAIEDVISTGSPYYTIAEKRALGAYSRWIYILHKTCWTRDELEQVVNSTYEHHHPIWMRSGLDGNAIFQITPADLGKFRNSIEFWDSDSDEDIANGIELLVCPDGGYDVVWLNPAPEEAERVLEGLRKRATELGIEIEDT